MFSPLNVIIRPSRIKRWLYFAIHVLAAISIVAARLSSFWQATLLLIIICSACYLLYYREPLIALHWDLSSNQLRVASGTEPLRLARLSEIYLLFGILSLHLVLIENQGRSRVRLLIFPDSVDTDSYRRLRVAARWGKLKAADE